MYQEIVDFAELQDFMDQKLKNYSSGMQVRLAFSVAIKAQGDILILDEVLAVGDEAFQRKCNDYFRERKQSGKTTILVTHDMAAVKQYCNRAVLIKDGLVLAYGDPNDVANQYSLENTLAQATHEEEQQPVSQLVKDLKVTLLSPKQMTEKDAVVFEITYTVLEDIPTHVVFSMTDMDRNIWIYNDNSYDFPTKTKGKKTLRYTCHLHAINNIKLKLQVTVLGASREMLAYANSENAPIIVMNRSDIPADDFSANDSAAGLVNRNGEWIIE